MFHKKYNDRKISEVLGEFIQKNKRIQIHHELKLIQDAWKSEMGDMINGYTSKFFIKHGKLEITLTSAPLRAELSMSKPKVIKLLNEKIGYEIIKEIVLR